MSARRILVSALASLGVLGGVMCLAGSAIAAGCPNEEFRTGPSASLPDCRAYELITPEELGRTQAMTFTTADAAIPSPDGEQLALKTFAPLEPRPSITGTHAVYTRTSHGWTATSIVAPELAAREISLFGPEGAFSPDLSQVAFVSEVTLNQEERLRVPQTFQFGPVGGPYTVIAESPKGLTRIAGANAGTESVPAFTDVLLESEDHQLLPAGAEREIAEQTVPPGTYSQGYDLYDWSEGKLRLVNVEGAGANVKVLNSCGDGSLGGGLEANSSTAVGAVSTDGSEIFFSSCGRLYMRVDGSETIEISAPAPGVELNPAERSGALFNVASADGSEVVFQTATPLLEHETDSEYRLFIYDTVSRELKLIAANRGIPSGSGTGGKQVIISEDGTVVYYEANSNIYRYETQTGKTSFVAGIYTPAKGKSEYSYTTPNGQFLTFASGAGGVEVTGPNGLPELQVEPRGADHNELYRYDAADGSVICVSCGEGVAPAEGEMLEPSATQLGENDLTPPFIQMSENGQRVFFQTTARLVPQDTNSTAEEAGPVKTPGMDVYEWEADGTEEAPGVFCRVVNGCTHLITTGEDVGKAVFLGASENGDNVFFATAGQLVPQADAEFPNIYDARVDGGFAPPRGEPECLSCQGVGSPPPLFSTPASVTFVGAGNPAQVPVAATSTKTKTKTKTVKCGKDHVKRKGKCVKTVHGKKVKRASRGARR